MPKLGDKLGFAQTFLFLLRCLFLHFFSSVSLFYVSATALNKSAMLQITMCSDLTWVRLVKERVCQLSEVFQHEFANLSLPCGSRFQIKVVIRLFQTDELVCDKALYPDKLLVILVEKWRDSKEKSLIYRPPNTELKLWTRDDKTD